MMVNLVIYIVSRSTASINQLSTEKIDGAVAFVMGLTLAMTHGNGTSESVENERGLIIL